MVTRDAHLGVDVVLELEVIAVKMVGCDVHQDRYVRAEVVHVIQLERAELYHVVLMILLRYLQRQRVAYVPCQPDIQSGAAQHVVYQRGRRGLAVRAGDTYHLRLRVPCRELYLRDDRRALLDQRFDHRCAVGYTGRLHHLVGTEYQCRRMLAALVGNSVLR